MELSAKSIWKSILDEISKDIPNKALVQWLSGIKPVSLEDGTLYLKAPNEYFVDWIKQEYMHIIVKAIRKLKLDVKLDFVVERRRALFNVKPPSVLGNLNPKYTFENFVVGKENQIVFNIALSIARAKANYSPVFIQAPTGFGKTHLAQAIANEYIKHHRGAKVQYTTAENFFSELLESLKNGNVNTFKHKYRNLNLLILDNFHFVKEKPMLQEEILHTLDELLNRNAVVILCSILPPEELSMKDELRSRISMGITLRIEPPSKETLYYLLRRKCTEEGLNVDENVLWEIASSGITNIREVEGAVRRLSAYLNHSNGYLGYRTLREIFQDLKPKRISMDEVMEAVVQALNIPEYAIRSRDRRKRILYARYIVIYLLRTYGKYSFKEIGAYLNRDHSTIINAWRRVRKLVLKDRQFKHMFERVAKLMKI